jgi:hypothetical protein
LTTASQGGDRAYGFVRKPQTECSHTRFDDSSPWALCNPHHRIPAVYQARAAAVELSSDYLEGLKQTDHIYTVCMYRSVDKQSIIYMTDQPDYDPESSTKQNVLGFAFKFRSVSGHPSCHPSLSCPPFPYHPFPSRACPSPYPYLQHPQA